MLYDAKGNTMEKVESGWIDQVLSSGAFQDYEGVSLEDLRNRGIETRFVIKYFQGGRVEPFGFTEGDERSVNGLFPHDGDRLVHIHYHPSGNVLPARKDIHRSDQDAALLKRFSKNIEVPPVYMIGADVDNETFYLARLRKDFPKGPERYLLGPNSAIKPEWWEPIRWNRFEYEWQKAFAEMVIECMGPEAEKQVRGKDFDEVVGLVGGYKKLAEIGAKSLGKAFGYKTGVVETTGRKPKWIYGKAELFR